MRVYVETDFLKEIAYRQADVRSCVSLVTLAAERGAVELFDAGRVPRWKPPSASPLDDRAGGDGGQVGRTIEDELDQIVAVRRTRRNDGIKADFPPTRSASKPGS